MTKKLLAFLLSAIIIFSFAACGGDNADDNQKDEENGTETETDTNIVTLVFDYSLGNVDTQPKKQEYTIENGVTPQAVADALSEVTGLDFFVTITEKDGGLAVDWAANSTLVANLDDREQKEEFFFFDTESMRWFMMDTLSATLKENFNYEIVYYSMDGGKDLSFEELYPTNVFPADLEYMGSGFYFAHADTVGDEEAVG